jgi:4-amino-4-deoxy-L-arabinose transferase-like glycosyltransferase
LKLPNPLILINKPSGSFYKTAIFIAFLGSIWAFGVHTHNLYFVSSQPGVEPGNGMILTADDPSYLRPVENCIQHGVWKDNSQGVSAYIQRPPGMSIIHGMFYLLSSHQYAVLHKIFNTLLHFLSIFVFGLTAFRLLGKRWAILVQWVYALLPCFWGYLFYFLTESITPSLLVFLVYGYVQQDAQPGSKWLLFQAAIGGCLLITRPQLGIFLLPFFFFLVRYIQQKQTTRWVVVGGSMLLLLGGWATWQIRSVSMAGRWVGLHPIYDVTNNSQYRPVHRSFGQLFKVWEHNSQHFHAEMDYIWLLSVFPDSGNIDVQPLFNLIPSRVFSFTDKAKFEQIFNDYSVVCEEMHTTMNSPDMPLYGETDREIELRRQVDSLTRVLQSKMWKENYFITPLHSVQWMFTKSQLNLAIFQQKYRGEWWLVILRYGCVFIIIASTLFTLIHLLAPKDRVAFLMSLSVLAYLFYLFFIQKMNEERYLMPLLPLLFLYGLVGWQKVWKRLFKRT